MSLYSFTMIFVTVVNTINMVLIIYNRRISKRLNLLMTEQMDDHLDRIYNIQNQLNRIYNIQNQIEKLANEVEILKRGYAVLAEQFWKFYYPRQTSQFQQPYQDANSIPTGTQHPFDPTTPRQNL